MSIPVDGDIIWTLYGWSMSSFTPPYRRDLMWYKLPEGHIYDWSEDGWHRISPKEWQPYADRELSHG